MIESALKQIGLTDGEVRVYLALLDCGECTSGKITQKASISGSKVYEVLDRLISKGLASFSVRNGVKHFEAAPPERIIDYLTSKQDELGREKAAALKIIPELALRQKALPSAQVRVFTGFEGLKTATEDILRSLGKGEEWLSMGLTEQPRSWEAYFTARQRARAKKGIIQKHLLNEKYRSLYDQRKALAHTQYRFLSNEFEMPTSTEIYGNNDSIYILVPANPMAVLIESKAVAESFRKYFYALWRGAKKPSAAP